VNIPFSITPTTITTTKFTADIDDVDIATYTPTNPDLVIVAITFVAHYYFFYFAVPAVAIRTTGKEVAASLWTGPPPSQSRSLSSTGACEGVVRTRRFKPRSAIAVFHSESITQILNRYPRKPVDNGLRYAWAIDMNNRLLYGTSKLLANVEMLDGDGVSLDGYGTRDV
jgi:hypothetical protein